MLNTSTLLDFFNNFFCTVDKRKFIKDISVCSYDSANKKYLIIKKKRNIDAISMDDIAKEYSKKKKGNILNTVDALIVGNNKKWYFIEFKNQKLNLFTEKNNNGNTEKNKVEFKALYSLLILFDIFFHSSNKKLLSTLTTNVDYFDFIKKNFVFCLVASKKKIDDPILKKRLRNNQIRLKEHYNFFPKLDNFFNETFICTDENFEQTIIPLL